MSGRWKRSSGTLPCSRTGTPTRRLLVFYMTSSVTTGGFGIPKSPRRLTLRNFVHECATLLHADSTLKLGREVRLFPKLSSSIHERARLFTTTRFAFRALYFEE